MNKHEEVEKWKASLGLCPQCGEIRALTVKEVNTDPLVPDFIKELIVPILLKQRELQRQVAGTIELAYRRGKQEGEENAPLPTSIQEALNSGDGAYRP